MPFLVSAVLVGVGLFIRLRLGETPAFRQLQAHHEISRAPIMEIITANRRMFFVAIGLKLSEIAYVSIATIFSITHVTTYLGLPRTVILNGILLGAAIELVTILAFGWISDCFGRKPLFVIGCLLSIAFAFPMFWLFETRNPSIIAATVAIAVSFGQGMMFGLEATWVSELFAARLRYSGRRSVSKSALRSAGWSGGAIWPISLYLILLAAITLTAAVAAPETAGKPLS
jgi:MHS family shikimate/dehydroshikimate transporter-like MFS transporter